MSMRLTDAPSGEPLVLTGVVDPDLALRLRRMGLFEGSEIVRLDQEVLVQPIRVRGPRGEAVLGGGMAMKIVVHLDDGRRLPLTEVQLGESGHIEGITGGTALSDTLEVLGLQPDDRIEVTRKLPPMEYITVVEPGDRVLLTEGMAAKSWGRMDDWLCQFVSARVGQGYHVIEILGGTNARRMLRSRGIEPGKTLVLQAVAQAQTLQPGVRNPVVISSREGLRLFLEREDGERILVRKTGAAVDASR